MTLKLRDKMVDKRPEWARSAPLVSDDAYEPAEVSAERPKPVRIPPPKKHAVNGHKAAALQLSKNAIRIKTKEAFLIKWRFAFSRVQDKSLETGLPATTRLVLWAVSAFMNKHGTGAYPGQQKIADYAGLGLRVVKLHLQLAWEKGWLKRELSHNHPYGKGYEYAASIPPEQRCLPLPAKSVADRIRNRRRGDSSNPGFEKPRVRRAQRGDS